RGAPRVAGAGPRGAGGSRRGRRSGSRLAPEGEHRPAVVLDDVAGARGERRPPERLRARVRRERQENAVAAVPLEDERGGAGADTGATDLRSDVEVEDLEVGPMRHLVRQERGVLA